MTRTLSNPQRRALRSAIAAHPDWTEYRTEHGITTADLSSRKALEVAEVLGVDIDAAIGAKAPDFDNDEPREQTPVAPQNMFGKKPAARARNAQPSGNSVQDAIAALMAALEGQNDAADSAELDALRDRVYALEERQAALLVIDPEGNALGNELPPMRHPMLETLIKALGAKNASGDRLNVWIAGPAGSGKTHAAKQAAEALGLEFGFHGAMLMAHELVGFVDAAGTYHETQFVKRFRDGGLCLLDELDSGSNEALLTLNAALANGQMSLPNGEIVARNPDFVCLGAANTFGQGATAEYIGRNRIDAAFLSRFSVKLSWEYDEILERELSGNPDWAKRVQRARKKAETAGLKIVIDPRHSQAGAALIAAGFTADQAADMTYLAGLTKAQRDQVKG